MNETIRHGEAGRKKGIEQSQAQLDHFLDHLMVSAYVQAHIVAYTGK